MRALPFRFDAWKKDVRREDVWLVRVENTRTGVAVWLEAEPSGVEGIPEPASVIGMLASDYDCRRVCETFSGFVEAMNIPAGERRSSIREWRKIVVHADKFAQLVEPAGYRDLQPEDIRRVLDCPDWESSLGSLHVHQHLLDY